MKTKIIRCILTGGIFLTVLSCKKHNPQQSPPVNTPVFYFNGTINNVPTNIQAGINNYYMFTSYALDGNGVYDYMGEFRNTNCTSNCPSSLKIYIKDYRQYSIAPTNIDSTISIGYYTYATPAGGATKYAVQFYDSLYNGTTQNNYSWNFGDGTTSNQDRPIHLYTRPGIYNVSLNAQSTSSCSSSLNNDVMVGQVNGRTEISFNGTPAGNSVSLSTTSGGGTGPGTYSFHWDFGDGNFITTAAPTVSYTYATAGVYPVVLRRTDAANTVEICHENFPTQFPGTCYLKFFPTTFTPVANPMNLADVTIEWRDASGNLYTSANNSQPNNISGFKIISVGDYQNNSSGQPTKIIHAKVTCKLYNGTSNYLLDGDVIFSVAHQ